MPRHFEKRKLPYTCEQLYSLVADIEQYPAFLPWCLSAHITKREGHYAHAVLDVGYRSFRESFASHVHFSSPHMIVVEYGGGPLKHLSTKWEFAPSVDQECIVSFSLSFAFKSFFFGAMMDLFFDRAFRSMVSAFEARAKEIYGEKKNV